MKNIIAIGVQLTGVIVCSLTIGFAIAGVILKGVKDHQKLN